MAAASSNASAPGLQTLLEQGGVAHHGGEQVVEIVGDAAGQPADRLQLLHLPQLLFQRPAAGHVGEDGDAAGFGPRRVEDRVRRHAEPALARGGPRSTWRPGSPAAEPQVRRLVEGERLLNQPGVGPADDLGERPAEQLANRAVAAEDDAGGVQKANRIADGVEGGAPLLGGGPGGLFRGVDAQQGANRGQHLSRLDRLDEVAVGPGLQARRSGRHC